MVEVVLLFFHMKKASRSEKFFHMKKLSRGEKFRGPCVWPFLSSSWVAFGRPSYLWAVLPGVPQHWRFPPASGSHPPRLIPPSGGWVYCLAPKAPQKGNADGAEGIFGLAGRVWASALRPGTP